VSQLILTIEGVHLGLGKHIWTVSPMNQVPAAKVSFDNSGLINFGTLYNYN